METKVKEIDNIKEIQTIELNILTKSVDLFNTNNISYILAGGTMLGAVRHNGFIPWDNDIDIFIRIAVFHYLFGYVHPFYDGNGRTSRFISSYLLAQQLTPLIGFRLSYTIKENISKYYKAFDVCNDPHNKGELTPFVEMFLNIVELSMQQLLETLEEKKQRWDYYCKRISMLPNSEKTGFYLYDLLIQASLFSNIGISREEIVKQLKLSENTVRSRIKLIPESLLIVNRQKSRKFYLLNLEEADKLFVQ